MLYRIGILFMINRYTELEGLFEDRPSRPEDLETIKLLKFELGVK
jgi:hypothetical protein